MLSAEQVIPFLSNDDPLLRTHAVYYLTESAFLEFPLTADQCWAAIHQVGLSHASDLLRLLPLVSQHDASTLHLLASLSAADDEEIRKNLIDAVAKIDFEQLTRHREEIFATAELPENTRAHLQIRLDLASLSFDALWQQLEDHAQATSKLYWNEIDHSIEIRLIEAIIRHSQPAIDRALAALRDADAIDETIELFAIEILGELRHRPALDQLLKTFNEAETDDSLLLATLEKAFPLVGGLDIIAPLEARFKTMEWELRLYAAQAISRLHHPEAEATLIRLFNDSDNLDARGFMALALMALCTTDALPLLAQMLHDGFPDGGLKEEFETDLVACSLMANFDFQELPLLRELVVTRTTLNRVRREIAQLRGIPIDQLDDDLHQGDFYEDDAFDDRPVATQTIRNTQPKIGRNDPCPCGSGKKYKKCCLK